MITRYIGDVTLSMLTSECCLKYLKLVWGVAKNLQNGAEWPFTTNPYFVFNIQNCMFTKHNDSLHFDDSHVLDLVAAG